MGLRGGMVGEFLRRNDVTVWNYIGWAWIIWTLLNEGLAMMLKTAYVKSGSVTAGVISLILSALAVWAALS